MTGIVAGEDWARAVGAAQERIASPIENMLTQNSNPRLKTTLPCSGPDAPQAQYTVVGSRHQVPAVR